MTSETKQIKMAVVGLKSIIDDFRVELKDYESGTEYKIQTDKYELVLRLVEDRIFDGEKEHKILDEITDEELKSCLVLLQDYSHLSRLRVIVLTLQLEEEHDPVDYRIVDVCWKKDASFENPFKKILPEILKMNEILL